MCWYLVLVPGTIIPAGTVGAFKIALDNEAPLVPLSIEVPRNVWNSLYPLNLLWGGSAHDNEVSFIFST